MSCAGVALALFVAFVAMKLWLHRGNRGGGANDSKGGHNWQPLRMAGSSCGSEDSIELSGQGQGQWGV